MPHKIRLASPADAKLLAAIDVNVNINPWNEHQFATVCGDFAAQDQCAMVIGEGDRIDGFVVFAQVLDEASIYGIGVHSAYQGKGLGQMLLASALRKIQDAGALRCILEVRQSNAVARRLYEGAGFELDGIRKNYYPTEDGREDALLMSLSILRNSE